MKSKHKTIPIFVSHMGCPNDCAFCNQRTITGKSSAVTPEMAEKIICDALATIPKGSEVEIGFFGGSFTGIDRTLQEELLSVANEFIACGSVQAIRLSTRPDYIDEEICSMLKTYGVTTVELGAQSMEDCVLEKSMRGHTQEDTVRAANMIRASGINLGLQMMTGLPGDTNEKSLATAKKIIDLKPSCVRIYPTLVLKGTRLEKWYLAGEYVPQTLDEAVSLCAQLKTLFEAENIPVIRMGLVASDNISPEKDVVAGPFHPAFGELVQSEIYFEKLKNAVTQDCSIVVHPSSLSSFCGNKKRNIERLKKLGFSVSFVQDTNIAPKAFEIIRKKGGRTCGYKESKSTGLNPLQTKSH